MDCSFDVGSFGSRLQVGAHKVPGGIGVSPASMGVSPSGVCLPPSAVDPASSAAAAAAAAAANDPNYANHLSLSGSFTNLSESLFSSAGQPKSFYFYTFLRFSFSPCLILIVLSVSFFLSDSQPVCLSLCLSVFF